ncbi:peptidase M23 [Campylobacter sp. MIT 12-5580]|uniref:M23 family metallopeptidase n=1 Tax=Campylobacter sp. MIT 12-5580 TaxID=2040651 RepID=UPI0010F44AEC|nr:M23 family metallopeptidase [Campylobacter sp. MIT 12-5580]TKX28427.1 peptidase M23 [Campylobacter sp. MIT 12-5580]
MARRKKTNKIIFLLVLVVIALALFFAKQFEIFEKNPPVIYAEDKVYLNLAEPIIMRIADEQSGLASIKITLKKDSNDSGVVIKDERLNNKFESTLEIFLPKNSYKEKINSYIMQVEAKDKSFWNFFGGNTAFKEILIILDDKKPLVSILSNSYQIEQGGAASVVFKVKDENLDQVFIQTDKGKVFAVSPYLKQDYYASLIAWDSKDEDFRAYVVAKDKAGNTTKERIRFYLKNRQYRNSNIALNDRFLEGKIQTLAEQYAPQGSNFNKLESFKFVNEDLRLGNEKRIHALTAQVSNQTLKSFPIRLFLPLKNAMKVADFADHRFYSYEGEFVSDSYHMGLDLASVAKAPIFSSNDGRVVFAEENGIYGINIVIDHGFGLYSLYGHCTVSEVSVGDEVKAGDIIADTGVSGLALGDHLHFGILIQGVEVRPEEWQDSNWIKNNISKVLDEGKKIIQSETR